MLNRTPPALFCALGLLSLPGMHCRGSNPYPSNTPTVDAPMAAATAPEAGRSSIALSDAQILAITAAANDAEVDQGNLARAKAEDPRIRDFASMMVDHHSEVQREQRRLNIPPAASADSERRIHEAEAAFQGLQHEKGHDFDAAYLRLQIAEHRNVLDTLKHLVPAAKDARLKAFLEGIKPTVESHLAQAERLQQEMGPGSSTQQLGPS